MLESASQIARFRGTEMDTAGDGFFARFDGPARAIECARAIRDSVQSSASTSARASTQVSASKWTARLAGSL